jgi:ABC-type multidrug transport system fused ATPase/permease subunit
MCEFKKWKNAIMNNYLTRILNLGMSYRMMLLLVLISLATTVTEIFGVGLFLPIFQFMRLEGDLNALVSDSTLWQHLIDGFSFFNIDVSMAVLLTLSFALFLFRQFFIYIRLVYTTVVTQHLIQIQRNNVFGKYIDADASYHDSTPVGNLVNVIVTEVERAVVGIMSPMGLIVYAIMLIGYLSVLFLLSWEVTIASIVVLLLTSQIPRTWISRSAKTGKNLVSANISMSEFLVERLHSPRLIRLSGTEFAEKNEFYKATQYQRKYSVLGSILQAKTDVAMEPIVVGLSLVFLYFSYTVLQLQIEIIGLYLVAAMRLMPAVKGIVKYWQLIKSYSGSVEAIEDSIRGMSNSIEKDTGLRCLNKSPQSIIINKLSYQYPEADDFSLKDINIKLNANEIIAIVGPSGSGKSTLVDLLPRLRLPTKGVIQIDGIDIQEYTLESLRKVVSYAPQFPQIFNSTVKNHILYGKSDATDSDVLEAAQLSGAVDFINLLPQKFDTILGDGAVKLSGGQMQRLDLARSLIKKSEILILDEPTSNLDIESEIRFKEALYQIRNKTDTMIIIITHQLSSISDADQIIVLNDGRVEASGSHVELLRKKNWYSRVWKMQTTESTQ